MISERTLRSLPRLLDSGLRDAFGGSCEARTATAPMGGQFVMLTISHLAFRLIVCLQVRPDDRAREFVARRARLHPDALDHDAFRDAVCEMANELCGAMKRKLGAQFSHLGLSTPNLLDGSALPHLLGGDRQAVAHALAVADGEPLFGCSLSLCPSGAVDFQLADEDPAAACGVLELF